MIQLSGINEEMNNECNNDYYKNENKENNEVEDINNLLNNLKNGNNNYYKDYNIFPYPNRESSSYFDNLLIKKDKEKNFVNYFKNNQRIIETSEANNNIRYDTPSKQ